MGACRVSLGVVVVYVTVLYQIINLEDFIPRLGVQVNVVVADLVQVTVAGHVEVGRHELVGVLVRHIGQSAVVVSHGVTGTRDLPRICTLQVLPVHGVRNLRWPLGYGCDIASSLLLDKGRGVGVLNSWIAAFRPAPTAPGHVCGAPLAVSRDHRAAGIEHLERPAVVVAQLVAVFFLVKYV